MLAALALLAACAHQRADTVRLPPPSPWASDLALARQAVAEGRFEPAAAACTRALSSLAAAPAGDPRRIETLDALAGVYSMQGRMDEAEKTYRSALDASSASGDPRAALGPLRELGLLEQSQGRYDDARPYYQKALAIVEKEDGPASIAAAERLEDLALLEQSADKPNEAEPLYRRAIEIRQARPADAALASALRNFASFLKGRRRLPEAEAYYKRSLEAQEKASVPDREALAQTLDGYGDLLRMLKRGAEAAALEARARALRGPTEGPQ